MPKGVRYGGRTKGTPNKATAERREREQAADLAAEEILRSTGKDSAVVTAAVQKVMAAKPRPRDEMVEALSVIRGIAGAFQKAAFENMPGTKDYQPELWDRMERWFDLYTRTGLRLADFFDPRYRAHLVAASPGEATGAAGATQGALDASFMLAEGSDRPAREKRALASYLRLVKDDDAA